MDKSVWFGLKAPLGVFANPLIQIEPFFPLHKELARAKEADAFLFTSKTAVHRFWAYFPNPSFFRGKIVAATGKATACELKQKGIFVHFVPKNESQEGLIEEIFSYTDLFWYWPKSAQARPLIESYFAETGIKLAAVNMYRVAHRKSCLSYEELSEFSRFIFTSPSTVDSYFEQFSSIPAHVQTFVQGEVTKKRLEEANHLKFIFYSRNI